MTNSSCVTDAFTSTAVPVVLGTNGNQKTAQKTCVILQPSYIPWRGYFDQIFKSDVFVFYDDVQYDKHGWRNRNLIKTSNGPLWLTIPVASKGVLTQSRNILDIPIVWDRNWTKQHTETLRASYARAPHFKEYMDLLMPFYQKKYELLADFTIDTTVAIAAALGYDPKRFVRSSNLGVTGDKNERLINIIKHVNATNYITGPSAQDYIDASLYTSAGIQLEFMNYEYQEYPQLHPPFDGKVSVLDLLFMMGAESLQYMQSTTKLA
jgi:hypothetical protein